MGRDVSKGREEGGVGSPEKENDFERHEERREEMCPRGFGEIAFCRTGKWNWGWGGAWPQPGGAGSTGKTPGC